MKDKNQNKRSNKSQQTKTSDVNLDQEAKELIRKAMISSLKERQESEKGTKRDLKALSTVIEEFLPSFIILGYTFDGDPIHCISARNQQEADSLVTLINKFFHSHISDEDPEQS
jgi:hypothetical protein